MLKRTMQKALRPSSRTLSPPPSVRPRTIERMQKLMKEAFNGSRLGDQWVFALDYLSAVVSFHNAADPKTKDRFLIQIRENEDRGHLLGFSREELTSLNFLVLQERERGQLSALSQRIKEKGRL